MSHPRVQHSAPLPHRNILRKPPRRVRGADKALHSTYPDVRTKARRSVHSLGRDKLASCVGCAYTNGMGLHAPRSATSCTMHDNMLQLCRGLPFAENHGQWLGLERMRAHGDASSGERRAVPGRRSDMPQSSSRRGQPRWRGHGVHGHTRVRDELLRRPELFAMLHCDSCRLGVDKATM